MESCTEVSPLCIPPATVDNDVLDNPKPTFIRLKKSEKKALKIERTKLSRKRKNLQYKENLARRIQLMDPDERQRVSTERRLQNEQSSARLSASLLSGLNVCIDLSFDEEHNDRDRSSLVKQLALSYSVLKLAQNPVHLHITSLSEGSALDGGLRKQGAQNWKVTLSCQAPWELFDKERVIILSPDSDCVLHSFDKNSIYVIGGIVDRSVRKFQTLERAKALGIRTARFPIQEYIPGRLTHILNVDHALGIICEYEYAHVREYNRGLFLSFLRFSQYSFFPFL
jgi:tRNA (guanine9-N1)-methyltransferase